MQAPPDMYTQPESMRDLRLLASIPRCAQYHSKNKSRQAVEKHSLISLSLSFLIADRERRVVTVTTRMLALGGLCSPELPPLTLLTHGNSQEIVTQNSDLRSYQQVLVLYDQLQPVLMAHLRGLGLTIEEAEDVTHETFLRLLRHFLAERVDENLRGWLYRVAYNLSMDLHRSRSHFRCTVGADTECGIGTAYDAADPAPGPEDLVIQKERSHRLRNAVSQLTVQQRSCILLRAKGFRYREIASRLGISVQRVAKLLERGTSRLAASL